MPQAGAAERARDDAAVRVGRAHPVIESTYDVFPQIQGVHPGPTVELPYHVPPGPSPPGAPKPLQAPLRPGGTTAPTQMAFLGCSYPGPGADGYTPPDPTVAAGPEFVVATINLRIEIYRKDGTLVFSQTLNPRIGVPGFFSSAQYGMTDPRVLYDQHSGRFVVVAMEGMYSPTDSHLHVAVSATSDPNGTWYKYRTWAGRTIGQTPTWADYPGLGADAVALYVSMQQFDTANSLTGTQFRVFNKAPMLAGQPATWTDLVDASPVGFVEVAHVFGSGPAAYFVSEKRPDTIRLHAIQSPLGTPTLAALDFLVPTFFAGGVGTPPRMGTSSRILGGGGVQSAAWRNGSLYTANVADVSGKYVVRWYEFGTNNWPASGAPTLNQWGDIDPGNDPYGRPIHTWMPSVTVNGQSEVGVVMAGSSDSLNCRLYVTGHVAGQPSGSTAPPVEMAAGITRYAQERWGDYYGIAVDPSDDATFWAIGQYTLSRDSGPRWIGSFTLGPAQPQRVLSVQSSGARDVPIVFTQTGCQPGTLYTNFTRSYTGAIAVNLTAPATSGSQYFWRWKLDGLEQAPRRVALAISMSSGHTTEALFLPCQGGSTVYGQGWAGTNGVPYLFADMPPAFCATFNLRMLNTAGSPTSGAVFVGTSPANQPIPGSGTLLVTPVAYQFLSLGPGETLIPVPVPCTAVTCGQLWYLQLLVQDPGAIGGVAFSPGLQLKLGV